jgi:cellulose synthase/poly-beta-1,6-N-acetylglucosamine synthase-like glycosyltransferase
MGKTSRSVRKSVAQQVAVITTVFNEEKTILKLIEALKSQTFAPSEVVIVDGGSSDRTFSLLQEVKLTWQVLRVYQQQGNRSIGRNFAISHTSCPIIAITDAGCVPQSDWLAEVVKPFSSPDVQVVSGYYKAKSQTIFQKCLVPYVFVMPDQADKVEFFPSTRSMAMRRSIWNQSGGFDTKLSHNEDYAFAFTLKKLGVNFTFAPNAIVWWIPRKNLKQAAWMFMRFAIGDIQAGILRPKVKLLAIRYIVFFFMIFLSVDIPGLLYLLIPAAILYLIWAILKNFRYVQHPKALFWLPVLQLTADVSVLFGSLVGLLSRIAT